MGCKKLKGNRRGPWEKFFYCPYCKALLELLSYLEYFYKISIAFQDTVAFCYYFLLATCDVIKGFSVYPVTS